MILILPIAEISYSCFNETWFIKVLTIYSDLGSFVLHFDDFGEISFHKIFSDNKTCGSEGFLIRIPHAIDIFNDYKYINSLNIVIRIRNRRERRALTRTNLILIAISVNDNPIINHFYYFLVFIFAYCHLLLTIKKSVTNLLIL